MPDLRCPIGTDAPGAPPELDERLKLLADLAEVPNRLRAAVMGLSDSKLDTVYRRGG